jgi:hypothetical protein
MRSSKTLFIILVVGFIIFVVSFAIGRPWWQALLFSIGFLLVAAIVTSRGLLIPEGLLEMRLSRRFQVRKPTEATDKTDKEVFLERMDLALTEFSAQSEATTEDIHWMTEYTRVMKEVGELVYAVHESVRSKDGVKELRAFREVTNELPRLISQFENIPELAIPKRQKVIEQQTQGLDLYLAACSDFVEALETSDGELAGEAAMQISRALDLLDVMDKSQLLRRR